MTSPPIRSIRRVSIYWRGCGRAAAPVSSTATAERSTRPTPTSGLRAPSIRRRPPTTSRSRSPPSANGCWSIPGRRRSAAATARLRRWHAHDADGLPRRCRHPHSRHQQRLAHRSALGLAFRVARSRRRCGAAAQPARGHRRGLQRRAGAEAEKPPAGEEAGAEAAEQADLQA